MWVNDLLAIIPTETWAAIHTTGAPHPAYEITAPGYRRVRFPLTIKGTTLKGASDPFPLGFHGGGWYVGIWDEPEGGKLLAVIRAPAYVMAGDTVNLA